MGIWGIIKTCKNHMEELSISWRTVHSVLSSALVRMCWIVQGRQVGVHECYNSALGLGFGHDVYLCMRLWSANSASSWSCPDVSGFEKSRLCSATRPVLMRWASWFSGSKRDMTVISLRGVNPKPTATWSPHLRRYLREVLWDWLEIASVSFRENVLK